MKRERIIVTGGRAFGYAPFDAEPDRLLAAEGERIFVVRTLYRELRVETAWAFDRLLVVVGDCPTGVDAITRVACETWGLHLKPYEADWQEGRRAGPIRNTRMVDDGAIRVLAFPGGRGTLDCVRRAERAGIPVERPIMPT